ncbi:MAG: hypothetical protein LBE27_06625, partial [Deltaproteobacteria bacterium]|nr:hypothetical protein [Deltaproteobacteria bacterium]
MQALIISATVAICLSLAILIFPSDLKAGPNVLDIQELKGLGLTDTTIEEIVTVSLRPRARKPLDADFIKLMAAYGGDGLTSAYLELDSLTAAYPNAPIGRDTIQRLIAAKVAKGEIIAMIRKAIDNTKKDDSQMAPSAGEEDRSSGISLLAGAGMAGAGLALGAGVSELNRSESAQSLPGTASSSSYSGLSGTTAPPGIWTPEAEDFSEIDSQNIPQARILEAESLETNEPLSRDSLEEEKLPKPVNDSLKQIESEELPALNAEL